MLKQVQHDIVMFFAICLYHKRWLQSGLNGPGSTKLSCLYPFLL